MAKKSSPVFYCGFCDMTLAKNEGIVCDTVHYCNDQCRKLENKTSVKDSGLAELRSQLNDLRDGVSRQDIKRFTKDAYEQQSLLYKKWLSENNPEHDLSLVKLQLCLYAHIHNGNKEKAVKALARFNDWTSETFEKMCVNSAEYTSRLEHDGVEEIISGEENVRVSGVTYKLKRETFKLMVDQM